jgi:DNA-binding winged helix-turn-helix (wHTH) protein
LGDLEFDAATGELRRGEVVVRLEPQPAALLHLLLSRPGELVGHAEIRQAVWGETTHVNFHQSLHYCIRQIRLALDDSARQSKYIQTIPRRGYRLAVPAEPIPLAGGVRMAPPAGPSKSVRRRLLCAGLAAAVVLTTLIIEQRPNRHHEIAVALLNRVHDLVY